ncbi:MAG: penicillin-binding protein 2 [Bacteroidales bacterium]|nr:penicillin-binding protein 2 [Bacteroidales bacterium]
MKEYKGRKNVVIGIVIVVVLAIWLKAFLLMFDESLKQSAENNSRRRVVQYPSRGIIYDRDSSILVCNEASYDLMLIPHQMAEFDTAMLCEDLDISKEILVDKILKAKKYSMYRPSVLIKQIDSKVYAQMQEHLYQYPGFYVQNRTLRKYNGGIAAHVLGDIGEVSEKQIEENPYYRSGDYVGKSGVERGYEEILRGEKGVSFYLVNVRGVVQGSYENGAYDTTAIQGKDINLTISSELQAYGEKLMANKVGAIVAIEPSTGEVLAMVSMPTYDPQLLVGRVRGHNYDSLLKAPYKPLINRAVSSTYPPGSTFKVAQALVALQEGVITPNQSFPCDKSKVGCHNHPTPTSVSMGIQMSCNPYFYFVFRKLVQRGIEKNIYKDAHIGLGLWKEKIETFGFNHAFNVGVPGVNKGQIPGPEYYDRMYGENRWAFSTIYSVSIGQGEVLVSPLQMANFASVLANRGYYITPHLIKKIDGKDYEGEYATKVVPPIDKKYFDICVEGMDWVVNRAGGTGRNAQIPGITVCGKTGTAQNPHGKDNSVFMAFAPKENPQIAIAVYVENAGFGGTWAAPIARLMMEKYIKGSISDPALETRILTTTILPNATR